MEFLRISLSYIPLIQASFNITDFYISSYKNVKKIMFPFLHIVVYSSHHIQLTSKKFIFTPRKTFAHSGLLAGTVAVPTTLIKSNFKSLVPSAMPGHALAQHTS